MDSSRLASLPKELLDLIVSFIGTEAPSVRNISREPSAEFTTSDDRDLKNFSLLCHRLRESALPNLFKYARLRLGLQKGWATLLRGFNPSTARLLLEMDTRDVCLEDEEHKEAEDQIVWKSYDSPSDRRRRRLQGTKEPLRFDHSAFREIFVENQFHKYVTSLVIYATDLSSEETSQGPIFDTYRLDDDSGIVCMLWQSVFSILNPTRVILLAPPVILAFLAAEKISPLHDDWAFELPYHLLELRLDNVDIQVTGKLRMQSDYRSIQEGTQPCLMLQRPWNYLLLNEGSHVKVYSTYDYYHKRPPSLARPLLNRILYLGAAERQFAFAYISVFPIFNHVASVLEDLRHSRPDGSQIYHSSITSIHLRLAPHPLDNLLGDPVRLGKANLSDCWTELDSAYSHTALWVRKLGDAGSLSRFSSGDYDIVELQPALDEKLRAQGWSQCGSGTWIKR